MTPDDPTNTGTAQAPPHSTEQNHTVRFAALDEAHGIAAILTEAFPALYRGAFGNLNAADMASLLAALYEVGCLSMQHTMVAVTDARVTGVVILHLGRMIGRGSPQAFWRALRTCLGPLAAVRAYFGGLVLNAMLDRRIPKARNLVYIEALAVAADHRGTGIGSALLNAAELWARQNDRLRIALHVLTSNAGARRLYERFGFRPWYDPPLSTSPSALFVGNSNWSAMLLVKKIDTRTEPAPD